MNLPARCDVVVVGSGPAGSLASGLLADKGYDVVLLDKSSFPRAHIGESLIPHFWKYTDLLGASAAIEAEGFIRKAGGTVSWNGSIRRMGFKDFGYHRPALHVERDRFDQILQEHAIAKGVKLFAPVLASRVASSTNGIQQVCCRHIDDKFEERIECRYVLDASGQKTLLGQQLNLREIDQQFRFFSVWGYYQGSRYVAADGVAYAPEQLHEIPPTTFVTSLPKLADWGWSWHIPLRKSTSVGLVLPMSKMADLKASELDWNDWFEQHCRATPVLRELLESATLQPGSVGTIRDYSYRSTRTSGPGFFMLGDAAGFIDPIFSVGIVIALYSAYAAAWATDKCLADPDQAARYHAIYDSQIARRMETSRRLALPGYSPVDDLDQAIREGIGFESLNEQALMNVVSNLTTRSANFDALGVRGLAAEQALDKITVLDQIVF